MGEADAPPCLRVQAAHHRPDVLPGAEPVPRVGDAGDGNLVDGNEGGEAAADIHKAAEGLQVGDPAGDNIPRNQAGEILLPAPLLCQPAAKDGKELPLGQLPQLLHHKGHRLIDAGDDGDIPRGPLRDAQGPLGPGNQPPAPAQVHQKVVSVVAEDGPPLQDAPLGHGLGHPCGTSCQADIFRGIQKEPLRQINGHDVRPPFFTAFPAEGAGRAAGDHSIIFRGKRRYDRKIGGGGTPAARRCSSGVSKPRRFFY